MGGREQNYQAEQARRAYFAKQDKTTPMVEPLVEAPKDSFENLPVEVLKQIFPKPERRKRPLMVGPPDHKFERDLHRISATRALERRLSKKDEI